MSFFCESGKEEIERLELKGLNEIEESVGVVRKGAKMEKSNLRGRNCNFKNSIAMASDSGAPSLASCFRQWASTRDGRGSRRNHHKPTTATGVAEISRKSAKKADQKWETCSSLLQTNISAFRSI